MKWPCLKIQLRVMYIDLCLFRSCITCQCFYCFTLITSVHVIKTLKQIVQFEQTNGVFTYCVKIHCHTVIVLHVFVQFKTMFTTFIFLVIIFLL